eukprot:scaffold235083_cov50-Attheya_sp.AAC.2
MVDEKVWSWTPPGSIPASIQVWVDFLREPDRNSREYSNQNILLASLRGVQGATQCQIMPQGSNGHV